ncbi:MAG TPA: VOC family protein [Chitinophagaceae bacterium]|nr:VOC family protein [Chitinophagaceae bacterium]
MKLTPYLLFNGNAEEVLTFYKEALGGEVVMLSRYADSPMPVEESYKQKIMHARLSFAGNLLMISDAYNSGQVQGNNISLSIEVPDKQQLETIFSKMAAGGKITMPLQDQFWGATFGMLEDQFGIHWMFNHEHAAAAK